MPLNAVGWTTEEDVKLAELVQPHTHIYNVQDPSRKNILARESTWQEIAQYIERPVEEIKKRWRGLRDGYMRSKRLGAMHRTKVGVFEKLQFLDGTSLDGAPSVSADEEDVDDYKIDGNEIEAGLETEQQVIMDNQEYYEITVVDGTPEQPTSHPTQLIKILPKTKDMQNIAGIQAKKIVKVGRGRKKTLPMPSTNVPPIKILPKPVMLNGPKIVRYVEEYKTPEQRSEAIDKLIEKVLKENTNEIDVFFRSMAASVKKLQPNLIPKVKMEVCNVIAKYEMQSFDK